MLKLPKWIRVVGLIETLFGLWGFYAIGMMLTGHIGLNIAAWLGLTAATGLAVGSIVAGARIAIGKPRALQMMLWVLGLQSFRVVFPGVVWLVSLGWTANLVLYLSGQTHPDAQGIAVFFGSHDFGSHIALNLLTLVPFIALLMWRRRAAVTAGAQPHPAAL